MTRVYLTHPSDKLACYYGERALQALNDLAEVHCNPHPRDLTTAELIEHARGCDAVIAYRQTPCPAALLGALPELNAFLRCAVDIRTVDLDAASAHGVLVTQASPGYAAAVAEWVIGVTIDLARGISRYAAAYHQGRPLMPFMGRELRGATLGIVGYGEIGQAVAVLALALGMRVCATTLQPIPSLERVVAMRLPRLLAESDFVVCLAPATARTANLIGADALASMKSGACFINAARGELVDEPALLAALDSGRLAGCALDVGCAPDQMPSAALARHPRVIATPHIGGLTLPAIEHQALETVAQLAALLRGELPPGAVNAEHATRLRRWGHEIPTVP